jgi:hypothetical protein
MLHLIVEHSPREGVAAAAPTLCAIPPRFLRHTKIIENHGIRISSILVQDPDHQSVVYMNLIPALKAVGLY